MNIFVGNLSRDVTNQDLQQAFGAFGEVSSANVIRDKYSGESRGFGFVEMPSKEAGQAAIAGLNGKDLKGRAISVNEARPRGDNKAGPDRHRGSPGRRRY
jgi:RNA recognition motif-containing protein